MQNYSFKKHYLTRSKYRDFHLFKNQDTLIIILIALTVGVNFLGLLFPISRNDDPTLYAVIAKNIILNHDWINLTYLNSDWLDKPHFQFWCTAISFVIFGINSFAYMLPGFIFNLIGAYYTYKLGKYLFNKSIGLLSTLIFLSSIRILISSTVDLRAEAYLIGTIVPSCYYYLIYFQAKRFEIKSLIIASIYMACAIMTKGIFVVLLIGSGIVMPIIYQIWQESPHFLNSLRLTLIKITLALALLLICITPELYALYIQFDAHPEKIIFGKSHVSGIKWFLWDSQFGRFFNTGEITRNGVGDYAHYFFFIHTILWSFLPWSMVFLLSIYNIIKQKLFKNFNYLFLMCLFFIPFIVFSITTFQLDYYTNIIIPFGAIICSAWIYDTAKNYSFHKIIYYFQIGLFGIIIIICLITGWVILTGIYKYAVIIFGCVSFLIFVLSYHKNELTKVIICGVLMINITFINILSIYKEVYINYDAGYNIAKYINNKIPNCQLIDYKIDSLSMQFYLKSKYMYINSLNNLPIDKSDFYIITSSDNLLKIKSLYYMKHKNIQIIKYFQGTSIDQLPLIIKGDKSNIINYGLIKVSTTILSK